MNIRIRFDGNRTPCALQISVCRYVRKDVTLDLISQVHSIEKEHAAALDTLFGEYDIVLEEGIWLGDPDDKGVSQVNPSLLIASMKIGMYPISEFDFPSGEGINADLSVSSLREGINFDGTDSEFIAMLASFDSEISSLEVEAFAFPTNKELFESDFCCPLHIRRALARAVVSESLQKPEEESFVDQVLVRKRNLHAIEVVEQQIEGGKRKLALHFGVLHYVDFCQRLSDAGFIEVESERRWFDVWDLSRDGHSSKAIFEHTVRRAMKNYLPEECATFVDEIDFL